VVQEDYAIPATMPADLADDLAEVQSPSGEMKILLGVNVSTRRSVVPARVQCIERRQLSPTQTSCRRTWLAPHRRANA
jgi:hypothetical protein